LRLDNAEAVDSLESMGPDNYRIADNPGPIGNPSPFIGRPKQAD